MPTDPFEQLLDRAAAWYGIDGAFWDIFGNHHTTSVAAKQSILRALGVAVDSVEGLERSLAELARHEWERLLPPVVVAGPTGPVELVLNVAAESLGEGAHFTVRREDGEVSEFDLNLWELPQVGSVGMSGSTWVQKKATLPVELPLGYHEVTLKAGGTSACTRYIVTPDRAWTDRTWAVVGGRRVLR